MDTLDQPTEAHKKIYNPKSNRMIIINGPAYRKLLCDGYMYWREERLLIPPLHESPILRSLLQILLKVNWRDFTLCQLLKLCWEREETKAWRNNVLMKFLHHPNLAPSKYRPGALYDAFIKTDVLGPEHILALARTFY
ncbi:hypothetical protein GLOIN_2v1765343 [Rhizophagus clarus]|uniref:Uncharacterized protein n=1 Tax=Rhizophagus clarus TaxID=94130 RepID=A0A8H3QHL8_9GLOM|nr:hypothetical protein GLOIN_2v1765343 [Rhizophagus clarus]